MRYKVLFLDLDGTILNTLQDIVDAVNYSLDKHGLPLKSNEQIRSYLGKGSSYLIDQAIDQNPDNRLFHSVYDLYKEYYLSNFANKTLPYDGTFELLKEFKDRGGKIALISNKPHDISIKLINKFFPNLFDTIYGNQKDIPTKPDPTSCKLAINELKIIDKKDILYVGDSLIDMQTAINAGLDFVLCNYGFELKENIIATKHEYINDIKELRGYLF